MSTVSNPGNGGFILGWNKPDTVVADNEAAGYEVTNAYQKYPTKIFKSENIVSINMTYNLAWKLTGIALINHNLTETANVKLRFYLDSNFSTLDDEKTVPFNVKNTYLIIDESTIGDYNYIQLYISDTSISTIQMGVIFPGTGFQFPHNYSWGYIEYFNVGKEVDTTDGGFHIETPDEEEEIQAPEFSKTEIKFSSVDRSIHDVYKNLIRAGNKIFIPTFLEKTCYYGIIPNKNLKATKEKKGDTYSIQFWEHSLIGGAQ
jgi:hypothetical protein